ncbi:hypothetical protein L596_030155 [Steinernema carpocapsae]|uniref:Uncharacterized protein n=1 Tax=Steinernema carpocapsae TaxID=34508 RepID=A0A4U5LRW5_STECR|nr:hypothetical protein L596_030155 [Steinernema carpocapsae]
MTASSRRAHWAKGPVFWSAWRIGWHTRRAVVKSQSGSFGASSPPVSQVPFQPLKSFVIHESISAEIVPYACLSCACTAC